MNPKLLRITTSSVSLDLLLKGQLSFLNQYYEVVGVASGKEGLQKVEEREGIRTVEVKMHRNINLFGDILSFWKMIRVVARERPFMIHANTPKGSLLGMIAGWWCRVPHRIYTVTGLRFETAHGPFRRLLIGMERLTCACATKVIPEGEGVRQTLIRERITRKPLTVILNGNINGVDMEHFRRSEEIYEQATRLKSKVFSFCFVGRLVRDKGIRELVHAFARLHEVHPDTRLFLVGPLEQDLDPLDKATLDLMNSSPGIVCTGYQSDIRPFLAASDVFVFPSYREGFPNVVMQAGAMGLPAIVTDISGSNEIILDGKNGMIIPPRDQQALFESMRYAMENKEMMAEMAANARPLIQSRYEQQMVWAAILREYQALDTKKNV